MGSESEKVLFNQFTMYVFPELMLVFAYTVELQWLEFALMARLPRLFRTRS